ncbi:MAG: aminopeptidase [Desulfohalobiaceae bacterium]
MSENLLYESKNCWQVYSSSEDLEMMQKLAEEYLDFLSNCKTERETVHWVRQKALQEGFTSEPKSGAVLRLAKDKSIFLARQGKRPMQEGLRIIGAHADSPRLDFKQRPLFETCDLALAKTHYYGGIRKPQWLSRPLALHGVVVRTDGSKIEVCIGEEEQDPVFVITDLLPHLAAKQNEKKLAEAFEGEKLSLLMGSQPGTMEQEAEGQESQKQGKEQVKKQILALLQQKYGLVEEDLYSAELQAVPAGSARFSGLDSSFLGGYGQDDRICVFAAFKALFQEKQPEFTQVVVFWDKEEIGSEGATSARSRFFEHCLQELVETWQPEGSLRQILAESKALSADVHGALDPDHQDLHDAQNASKLGFGPVLCKFTGHRGKIGANDASAEYVAWLRDLLNQAKIPWQMAELGKVDAGGGGTVAKHMAIYGLDIIDFGPSILGMHSPFEISSKVDLYAVYLAFREFLQGAGRKSE